MKTVSEGVLFSVFCTVERGSQPLFFQWFKNGQIINKQSDENEVKLIDETQSMFKIKKLHQMIQEITVAMLRTLSVKTITRLN